MVFFDIDTQHDFLDPEGALYVPDAESIRKNIRLLLSAAGEHRIVTVSSSCAHEENDPEFAVFPPHCVEGTYGAERVFPELPGLPRREIPVDSAPGSEKVLAPATHYLVKKKVYDLFSNRWLDALRDGGAFTGEKCVVFGVAVDYCVRAAGLGLAHSGARVLLVTDAIRGITPVATAQTLDELRAAGVEFTTTDEILKTVGNAAKETPSVNE